MVHHVDGVVVHLRHRKRHHRLAAADGEQQLLVVRLVAVGQEDQIAAESIRGPLGDQVVESVADTAAFRLGPEPVDLVRVVAAAEPCAVRGNAVSVFQHPQLADEELGTVDPSADAPAGDERVVGGQTEGGS